MGLIRIYLEKSKELLGRKRFYLLFQKKAALFKFFKVYKGVVIISEVNDVKSMNVNTVMLSEFDLGKRKLGRTFDFYK